MGRLLLASFLISNLLVCPFRCMSSESGATVVEKAAQPKCCCCQRNGDSSSKEELPENECACPNCICEGATLKDGPQVSIVGPQNAAPHWLIPIDAASEFWGNAQFTRAMDQPHEEAGGRAARIAMQTWLI